MDRLESLETLEKQLYKEHDKKKQLELTTKILLQSQKYDPEHFSVNYKKLILKAISFYSSSETDIFKSVKNLIGSMAYFLNEDQLFYLLSELGSIASSNRYKGSILLKSFVLSLLNSNSECLQSFFNNELFYNTYFHKINYTRKLKIKSYKNDKRFPTISLYSYIEPVLKVIQFYANEGLKRKVFKFIINVIIEETCNTQNKYNNGVTSNSLSNKKKKIKRIKLAYATEDADKKNRKRIKCIQNFTNIVVVGLKLPEDTEIFDQIKIMLLNLFENNKNKENFNATKEFRTNKQIEAILTLFLLKLIGKSFQYTDHNAKLTINNLNFIDNDIQLNYLKLLIKIFNDTKTQQLDLEIRIFYLNFIFGLIKNKVIDDKKYIYNFSNSVLISILKNNLVPLSEIPDKLKIITYSSKNNILTCKDLNNKLQSLCNFSIEYLEQPDTELGVLDFLYIVFKNAQEYKFDEFYSSTKELSEVLKLHFEFEHSGEHIKKYYRVLKEYYKHIGLFKGELEDVVTYFCRNIGIDMHKNYYIVDIICELKVNEQNIYDYYKTSNKNEYSLVVNNLEYLLIIFACLLNLMYENNRNNMDEEMEENKKLIEKITTQVDKECNIQLEQEMKLIISKNQKYKAFFDSLKLFK